MRESVEELETLGDGKSRMKALRSWLLVFVLLFSAGGSALWISGNAVARAHVWTPVRVPLALSSGESVTEEFQTDLNGTYWVMLQIKSDRARRVPFQGGSRRVARGRRVATRR